MRKFRVVAVSLLMVLSVVAFAQDETREGGHWFVPRFNVRVGLGGIMSESTGFADNIGGYVEMPLSAKYDNWKVNVGMKLSNRNLLVNAGYYVGGLTNDDYSDTWTYAVRELFIEVPVIFSYDFRIAPSNDLRLSFGLYYSRYVTGDVKVSKLDERYSAMGVIMTGDGATEKYNHDSFVRYKHSGGAILGIGYYFKDFYFGADFEMSYAWNRDCFGSGLYATFGYRF